MDLGVKSGAPVLAIFLLFCLILHPAAAEPETIQVDADTLWVSSEAGRDVTTVFNVHNLENDPKDVTLFYVRTKETGDYPFLEPALVEYPKETLTVASRGYTEIPVTISFTGLSSGEYHGRIQVQSNATELSVPIVARIKDPLWLPAIILVITVALSVIMFNWGFSGRKNAILTKSLLELRGKINGDEVLSKNVYARYFKGTMDAALDTAETKLRNRDYDGADEARKAAEKIIDWWFRNRAVWEEHLDTSARLESKIPEMARVLSRFISSPCTGQANPPGTGKTFVFLHRDVPAKLRQFWIDTANAVSETTIDVTQLRDLDAKVVKVAVMLEWLAATENKCSQVPDPAQKNEYCKKLSRFVEGLQDKTLDSLDFDDIHRALNDIVPDPKSLPPAAGEKTPPPVPLQKLLPGTATEKLDVFIVLMDFIKSTFLPIVILTIFGIYLLYLQNPTFGTPIDYVTLVLWGFMSCAATDGIWEKVSAFKLPKDGTS